MENNTISNICEDDFNKVLTIWPIPLGNMVLEAMGITGSCKAFYLYDDSGKYFIEWETADCSMWDAMIEWWQFRRVFITKKMVLTMDLIE